MWKDIIGFENFYEISDKGIVRSKDKIRVDTLGRKRMWKGRVLTPDIAPNGYYRITLCNGHAVKKQKYIHRLVAEHFIPNPDNLPQVNHKDGNKLNNKLENLEWVSIQENVIHAYRHGLINHVRGVKHPNYGLTGGKSKKAKAVQSVDVITGDVKVYESIIDTKKDGFLPSEVSRACKSGGTHHGHKFKLI